MRNENNYTRSGPALRYISTLATADDTLLSASKPKTPVVIHPTAPLNMATNLTKRPRFQRRSHVQRAKHELSRLKAQPLVGPENKPGFNFTPKYTEADFLFTKTLTEPQPNDTSNMSSKRDYDNTNSDRKQTTTEIKTPPLFYKRKVHSIIGAAAQNDLKLLENMIIMTKEDPMHNGDRLATEMNCALMQAVTNKSPTMVEKLLDLGANPSAFTRWYPVTLSAADTNCEDIVDIFLRRGLDFTNPCPYGTAMHSAARHGNVNILKKMIAANLDVNTKNEHQGATPLHIATQLRKKDAVECLLQNGALVNEADTCKRTPLHFAAMQGADDIADLLVKAGADISAVDNDQKTPWMHAAVNMHTVMADKLLALDNKIHQKVFDNGATYLHLACAAGIISCCEYLLQQGADIDAKDDKGNTPLMVAVKNTRSHVVRFLLSRDHFRCHVNHRNLEGNSALFYALEQDFNLVISGLLRTLKDAGADPNLCCGKGQSLLMRYVDEKLCKDKIDWLISNGANLNIVSENNETVLWHAVRQADKSDNLELVNLVLTKNFDIGKSALVATSDDTTPLKLALKSGRVALSDLLFHSGCSLNGLAQWLKTDEAKSFRNNESEYDSLCKAIELKLKNCINLQDITRLAVLATLGHNEVKVKTEKLEIPVLLKQYMELETYQRVSRLDYS